MRETKEKKEKKDNKIGTIQAQEKRVEEKLWERLLNLLVMSSRKSRESLWLFLPF